MDRQAIIAELKIIIGEHLKNQGLDLVDLIYRYEGRGSFLRVLADRPCGGITLDECARLNIEISALLDEKNILQQGYILEVSSPGIDRPLMTKSDFMRCLNRRARFFLKEAIKARLEWEGIIKSVEDDAVSIDIQGDIIEIPLAKINKAKQTMENF
ncbi:MAG: ribosome maturation factor RimP [Candidatus Omnitrophica bacterium]|nr:ribosome maturation factor RimP [Candidatus Omnitrophota bacterium]